jgi:hypothetical protein
MTRNKSGSRRLIRSGASEAGAERSEAAGSDALRRGRLGRRSADERAQAVLQLLSGKASLDQLALRFGVRAETIERCRAQALEGIEGNAADG